MFMLSMLIEKFVTVSLQTVVTAIDGKIIRTTTDITIAMKVVIMNIITNVQAKYDMGDIKLKKNF